MKPLAALPAENPTRQRRPDPSRPSTGVAIAPASSVLVSVHCALLRDTRYSTATLVINGAPRLPATATTRAMNMSEVTRTRPVPRASVIVLAPTPSPWDSGTAPGPGLTRPGRPVA